MVAEEGLTVAMKQDQRKEWPTLHKNHEGLGHPRSKDKVKIISRVKGDLPARAEPGVGQVEGANAVI
jgi:hypothetical protein